MLFYMPSIGIYIVLLSFEFDGLGRSGGGKKNLNAEFDGLKQSLRGIRLL